VPNGDQYARSTSSVVASSPAIAFASVPLPRGDQLVGAARDDGLEQHLLAAVVIVDQGDVHARPARRSSDATGAA
jgi:hypothetical protein